MQPGSHRPLAAIRGRLPRAVPGDGFVSPTGAPADPTAADLVGGPSFLAECDSAAPPCGPRFWARGEPVFWAIGDSKLVDLGLNAINSDAFNTLLSLTGKSYLDVAKRLLGDDRTGYRLGLGAWLDDGQTLGVEADFLRVSRPRSHSSSAGTST